MRLRLLINFAIDAFLCLLSASISILDDVNCLNNQLTR